MVYTLIRFNDGEELKNVLSCDVAPPKDGFITVWIDDDIFYLNKNSIRNCVVHAPHLRKKEEQQIIKKMRKIENSSSFTNDERW